MRAQDKWDIPSVFCFLVALVIALIGFAALVHQVVLWTRTNQWHSISTGALLSDYDYADAKNGWGGLQELVDYVWAAPFWACMLVLAFIIGYLPNFLRAIFGRRRR